MVENVFLNLCIPFSIRSPLSLIPRPVSEFSLEKNLSGTSGETELYAKNTDTDQEVQPEVQEQQQEGSLPADMEQYQYVEPAGQFAAMQNGFLVTSLNFGKPALESRIKNVLKEKRKCLY